MASHQDIDNRTLLLARAVAEKIDRKPELLDEVRQWVAGQEAPAYKEWRKIITSPWPQVREVLLQETDEGQRLRQSSPFVGVLTPQERWAFFPLTRS